MVAGVKMAQPKYLSNTLDELAGLKRNWNYEGARRIFRRVLKGARMCYDYIEEHYPKGIEEIQIFPISYGILQFEYSNSDNEYLEFEFQKNGTIEWFWSDRKDDCFSGGIIKSIKTVVDILEWFFRND